MARRKYYSPKVDSGGIILILLLSIPVFLFNWISENIGWSWVAIGVCVVSFVAFLLHRKQQEDRRKFLYQKYHDPEIVDKIMEHYFWVGQTEEQLIDSLGKPDAIDNQLLVTRTRQVWKYQSIGRGRYGLRITLDNQKVANWKQVT